MDNFLAPHSTEAMAHSRLSEDWLDWDISHPSFDESLVAHCASYHAFDRYLSGEDLFIPPRFPSELERVLRRHAYDSIHNAISRSRQTLKPGGYSRTCHLAEQSIRSVLNIADNARRLLAWHRPITVPSPVTVDMTHTALIIKV
ncbi:uncharacterized protein BJ212DRAFT_1338431 [Suillus subaureus]|uniref:Uncharacterized protein n=1 Tax=Suillus subaureus TaxID=48587 RepID=A0A9P7JFX5_9AGAM|nr:uncharacterized protein BJ212DRAFT_1338431 [Suillus subaureus]KAG1820174.1 hypothetical protein BJ212DRAFT_1338431 [Suillus subaureus]